MFVILSGCAAVGKNTVINTLLNEENSQFGFMPTYTTRAPRPGEVEGFPYHYLTEEQFRDRLVTVLALLHDFEEDVAEAMRIEYQYDEQGNILYDEAGNPMQEEKMQYGYYDLNGSIYAATEEEIEDFYRLLSRAVGGSTESEIAQIVVEEIAPFLNGQKNAEEVAAIIQSRAQLYLDENQ